MNKQETINEVIALLNSKHIDSVYLKETILTHYDNNGYMIQELVVVQDKQRVQVFQGPAYKYDTRLVYLDDFDESVVDSVYSSLKETLNNLKYYRVRVISYKNVMATDEQNAKKTATFSHSKYGVCGILSDDEDGKDIVEL